MDDRTPAATPFETFALRVLRRRQHKEHLLPTIPLEEPCSSTDVADIEVKFISSDTRPDYGYGGEVFDVATPAALIFTGKCPNCGGTLDQTIELQFDFDFVSFLRLANALDRVNETDADIIYAKMLTVLNGD